MNQENHTEILRELARKEIEILKNAQQPLVRVAGPWTTGGFGYEENIRRFDKAEKALRKRGYTIVDYFTSEETIKKLRDENVSPNLIMDEYHKPILESGYIQKAFFMPRSDESAGATWERNFIRDHTNIEILEVPEDWITEIE